MAFEVRFTLEDKYGKKFFKTYPLRTATATQAQADAATIETLLAAVVSPRIAQVRVTEVSDVSSVSGSTPGAEAAVLSVRLSTVGKTAVHILPGGEDGIYVPSDLTQIDGADTALLAYLDGVFGGTNGVAYLSDGETIADANQIAGGERVNRLVRYS